MLFSCLVLLLSLTPLAFSSRRIVAVGDLHGDWTVTMRVLRLAKIIDIHKNWIAGNAVLVQTGDMIDRGNATIKIFKLFESLKEQAYYADGRVIQLLGNHELMNLQQDFRYVTKGDIDSFRGEEARSYALSPEGWLGKLLFKRNITAKVGTTVFFHAGANAYWARLGVDGLNKLAKEQLKTKAILRPGGGFFNSVFGDLGPLWYRGYATLPEDQACSELGKALKSLGAERMVIGHTPSELIRSRCNGKLIIIDVGMSRVYRTDGRPFAAAIEIVGDRVYPIYQYSALNGKFL